jgi:hypothetical protein
MVIFSLGMLVGSGLMFRAVATGVFNLPPRDRVRVRTVMAPLALWFVCLAIFPWSVFF